MKLQSARAGQVVRNVNNGSHYRYERPERGKVRIWPLELFPNGLLICKPTPTIVEGDIEVVLVGPWAEDMVVEGTPSHSRRRYENELVKAESKAVELRAAYEQLPSGGTGKLSRGSWANKVKCIERRIVTLKKGLGFAEGTAIHVADADVAPDIRRHQLVQVPSGRIAKVMALKPMGNTTYATVRTLFQGAAIEVSLPSDVLRPAIQSRLCTA